MHAFTFLCLFILFFGWFYAPKFGDNLLEGEFFLNLDGVKVSLDLFLTKDCSARRLKFGRHIEDAEE